MRLATVTSDAARSLFTMRQRGKLAERRVGIRKPLARYRVLPDFLILGGQRCGTSSLYRYLGAHPDLVPGVRKEVRYFSTRFFEGEDWYRAHFPLRSRVILQENVRGIRPLTFEATPDYLFHPLAPSRTHDLVPDAKFIVLLRDPVERAFSHYKHMRRLQFEKLSFEAAIEREQERIVPDLQRLHLDPAHQLSRALRFSYIARGHYAEQLQRWFELFPRSQFLILDYGEFLEHMETVVSRICAFLDVRAWTPETFKNYSLKPPPEYEAVERRIFLPEELEKRVRENFVHESRELERLTGIRFQWR